MLNGFMEVSVDPKEAPGEIFGPAPRRMTAVEPEAVASKTSKVEAAGETQVEINQSVPVTFHKDVVPILQKRCQGCHRPGEIAPMSLLTYAEVRPWAKAIRNAVLQKRMPPWGADPEFGKFANDRSLSRHEISTLVSWVDHAALEGTAGEAPKPVAFEEGWAIGRPDMVLEMPKAFEVPATGTIPYQFIIFPTGFTEDKWIEKIEIRPGDPSVLHHAIASARPPGSEYWKDAPIGKFVDPARFRLRRGKDPDMFEFPKHVEFLHGHVPGGNPTILQPGQARLVKAGSDLILQLHYQSKGREAYDKTRIGLVFAKRPPKEKILNVTVQNFSFAIPPMVDDYPIKAEALLNLDVKVLSFLPHMHLRGKRIEIRAYYPDGRSEVLMRVPRWDFNWQTTYFLETPKFLPKGTRLESIGYYDNTPNNPYNPDPKATVARGEQTWDEMMGGLMDFAIDPDLDKPTIFIRVPRDGPKDVSKIVAR
jgi:hypothetical protein